MTVRPVRVTSNLFRGPRLESLEDTRSLQTLVVGGITIINLQSNNEPEQLLWARECGIEYHQISMCPVAPPSRENTCEAINIIQRESGGDRSVYLHCRAGVDRTGFVVARYRMEHLAWTRDNAIKEFREMGRHPWYFWWEAFL